MPTRQRSGYEQEREKKTSFTWERGTLGCLVRCFMLAATVRSFAHMPLGISDRNKMVWPGCEGRAEFSLHTKNVRSVWFVVKRRGYYCNLSGGVALIVWFTTNGMCAKNINICMWREQAIIEWSQWSDLGEWPLIMLVNLVNSWLCLLTVTTRVISIVACCKGTKLCTHAARDFRSQHSTPALRPSTATQWIVATGSNDNEEWFVEHQGPFAIAGSLQMHNC